MLNPLDLLIGPALRQHPGPEEGKVPGARRPSSPMMATAAAIATALALGWAMNRASASGRQQ